MASRLALQKGEKPRRPSRAAEWRLSVGPLCHPWAFWALGTHGWQSGPTDKSAR